MDLLFGMVLKTLPVVEELRVEQLYALRVIPVFPIVLHVVIKQGKVTALQVAGVVRW